MPALTQTTRETLLLDAFSAAISEAQFDRAKAIESKLMSQPLSRRAEKKFRIISKKRHCKPSFTERHPMLTQSVTYSAGMTALVSCLYLMI